MEIVVTVKKVQGGNPEALVWDGETIDIRWFTDDPNASSFYITYPAELAGLAALVNGIYNREIQYIWGDETYIKDMNGSGTSGENNEATASYHYGAYRFEGKTIYLCADIDMGSGNNYMPIGGAYLMTDEDTTTKISSNFCGMLDGQGHNVTIYCDRHCSGNYGDGGHIGLIGRLGVHDGDPDSWRPSGAGVRNLAVYGYVKGNRSVGGIVGKIGRTVGGATIENCANFASVYGTDAKGTGGVVGAAWNGGTIKNCYNAGTVTSSYNNAVAGVAGSCEIDLINCFNVGSVIGSQTQTAAVASNNGGSTYKNCYWLTGSADLGVYGSTTTGVIEKTSAEMKADAFVSLLGDAFLKDTKGINSGYPVLTWQGGSKVTGDLYTTTVANGVATTTVNSEVLTETLKDLDSGAQLTITADVPAGSYVYKAVTVLTGTDVTNMANKGISLAVSSSVADITLPRAALTDLASERGSVINITATTIAEDTTSISVTVDGEEVSSLNGGLTVTLPVSQVTSRTILVLVEADGTETVLENAVFGTNGVTVTISGSCILKVKEKTADVLATTEVKNGKATVTVDSDALAETLKEVDKDTLLVIAADVPTGKTVTTVETVLSGKDISAIASTGASLKVTNPIADLTLTGNGLKELARKNGSEVTLTAQTVTNSAGKATGEIAVEIAVDGKAVPSLTGGVAVSVHYGSKDQGNVLVLVGSNGSETIIKKSVVDAYGNHKTLLDGSATIKVIDNSKYFSDVSSKHWAADYIDFVTARELFNGTGNDVFSPDGDMTRAMLVTVLHRLEDEPYSVANSLFNDVASDSWYTDAVYWAANNKIVEGYGNGQFGTNDNITREQLATMLYRYAQYLGMDVTTSGNLSRFSDGDDVSGWASTAVKWAVGNGIITGKTGSIIDPQGNASRAEVATMLQRMITLMVQ